MAKRGKRYNGAKTKLQSQQKDAQAKLSIEQGIKLAVETATAKFDESIDVAIRLGIDPKQSD
ncbi:MAG: 50S ribosomal protein L1, partial [Bdellovibrionales bacterium]|nr:50S ribosomal protein L1 [Bdellovibrionales bacterium]